MKSIGRDDSKTPTLDDQKRSDVRSTKASIIANVSNEENKENVNRNSVQGRCTIKGNLNFRTKKNLTVSIPSSKKGHSRIRVLQEEASPHLTFVPHSPDITSTKMRRDIKSSAERIPGYTEEVKNLGVENAVNEAIRTPDRRNSLLVFFFIFKS